MSKYAKVESDIQEFFDGILANVYVPVDVKFLLLSNNKLKKLIKFSKINEAFSFEMKKDILVEINQEYFDSFDDEIKAILFEQEFGRLEFNSEKGTLKIKKNNFSSDKGVCEKYTFDKVKRAIETEEGLTQQQQDKKDEEKRQKAEANKGKGKKWNK